MRTSNVIPRACQNCRLRKTRCNRQIPCSNCLTSNIKCKATRSSIGSVALTREADSQRNAHEQIQLEAINERIERLERAVQSLRQPHDGCQTEQGTVQKAHGMDEMPSQKEWMISNSSQVHGESSFEGQVDMVSRMSQLPLPETKGKSPITNEMTHLRAVIQDRTPEETSKVSPSTRNDVPSQPISAVFVIRILQFLKESPRLLFLIHPLQDAEYFESLSHKIFFPVQPISTGELIVFYGILYLTIKEMRDTEQRTNIPNDQLQSNYNLCRMRFELGIQSHELSAVSTFENTLALALATLGAQLSGSLSLQWTLTSAAARHCINLGYHRESTLKQMSSAKAEWCRRLFWHVHMSNLILVLPLGRAPVIQKWDVDVQPPAISNNVGIAVWHHLSRLFVRFFTIQAEVYQQIYSPTSARSEKHEKQHASLKLAKQLEEWFCDWKQLDHSKAYHSNVFRSLFWAVNVAYYSVLTLIHRAATTSSAIEDIPDTCFDSAREGMLTHLSLYPASREMGDNAIHLYALWILVNSSFTPYIITFVHCITHAERNDLDLMSKVLETLEEMASVSETCRRQVSVCRALHRTARAFIESTGAAATKASQSLASEDKIISLPLHNQALEQWDWDVFETSMDEWLADGINPSTFNLNSRLDGSGFS